jgi:hypothetical protein
MAVSQRERSYFVRLGELKASSHVQAAVDHLALPLAERLMRSWALYETFRQTTSATQNEDEGPLAIYERARALGLYRR